MKNIQTIDGAQNCTYSLWATTDKEFGVLFPGNTDVGFSDEIHKRLGDRAIDILNRVWARPVDKKLALGIHGTIFYQLDFKKKYYPTRKEKEMEPSSSYSGAELQMMAKSTSAAVRGTAVRNQRRK